MSPEYAQWESYCRISEIARKTMGLSERAPGRRGGEIDCSYQEEVATGGISDGLILMKSGCRFYLMPLL